LLTLHLWHLTDRMFLARRGKQGHGKEHGEDAQAKEGSHTALAQLSVSPAMRKDESAVVGRDRRARRIIRSQLRVRARSRAGARADEELEEEL